MERNDQGSAPKTISVKRQLFRLALSLLPAVLGEAAYLYSEKSKAFAEWFAQHIQTLWVGTVGRFCSIFPFSVNEIALYILIPLVLFLLLRDLIRLFKKKARRRGWAWRFARTVCLIGGCLWLAACIGNGVNYNRETFAEKSGLSLTGGTKEELCEVCRIMIDGVNANADLVERDEKGSCLISKELPQEAVKAMKKLASSYGFLDVYIPRPKPVLWSEFLSECNLTGVYSPFTAESQYNDHMTAYNKPHTVCHELSHAAGFEREDEANFIGFLACILSDDPEFRYSGYLLGYIYATNALYGADYDLWLEVRRGLVPEASHDLDENTEYWGQYKSKVAEVSEKANDANLKLHNQTDGVKSYGRVVDLMLAYYRNELTEEWRK